MASTLDHGRLTAYIDSLPGRCERLAATLAHKVEAGGKQNAAVRTGYMRNSVQAKQVATAIWVILVGAAYGLYQELGTVKMQAHPFMIPALLDVAKHVDADGRSALAP